MNSHYMKHSIAKLVCVISSLVSLPVHVNYLLLCVNTQTVHCEHALYVQKCMHVC